MNEPAGRPDFAVIIPTLDRPEALERCLAALAAQTIPSDRFEVVVVDDGGREGIGEIVEKFAADVDVRLVRCSHRGPAGARNTGAGLARARILAFTDDDCRPASDWLEQLAGYFEKDVEALWGGRVVNGLEANLFAVTSQLILDLAYAHYNPDSGPAAFFASNNMALPADAFYSLGGFDPSFAVAAEDRDLCARWRNRGLRIAAAKEAVVRHEHDLSLWRYCRQHFGYGRGAWQYHRELRRRGNGELVCDLRFHRRCLGRALRLFLARPAAEALVITALLALWQVTNAAGFAVEAVRDVLGKGSGAQARNGCD